MNFLRSSSSLAAVVLAVVGCSSSSRGSGNDSGVNSGDAGCPYGTGNVGDQSTFAALTKGPIPCTEDSDCCVIFNQCTNAAQIVAAKNESAAAAAWPSCKASCSACIPSGVNVFCTSAGVCGGAVDDDEAGAANLSSNHCGVNGQSGKADANTLSFAGCGE